MDVPRILLSFKTYPLFLVIAITEGGVIPATLVYLGGFYKSTELATRLAFFWGVQNIASAVSGLMARYPSFPPPLPPLLPIPISN